MKLFINGEEYCDAEKFDEHEESYHEFGQLARTGADRRVTLRLTKPLAIGAKDRRRYELRDGVLRTLVSPYRVTDPDGYIPAFIEKRLPVLPTSHAQAAKLLKEDHEVCVVYDWEELPSGSREGPSVLSMSAESDQKRVKAWRLLCAEEPERGRHVLRLGSNDLQLDVEDLADKVMSQGKQCWRIVATSDENANFIGGLAEVTLRPSLSRVGL